MIPEEKLKKAIDEYEKGLLAALPKDIPEHNFSEEFEIKIELLTKTAKRASVYKTLRRFAYAAAVLLLFCGILLFHSHNEVQASDGFWAKRTFGEYIRYHYVGTPKQDAPKSYNLTWFPEGYTLIAKAEDGNTQIYIWESREYSCFFLYLFCGQTGRTSIDTTEHICSEETVDGQLYFLCISENPEDKSDIVWIDENDVLFHITAIGDKDTLLSMAKSVIPTE